ncbi:asparagine synthase (glutamine-hydrolyzing) [Lacibacter luteus]|uniref:asparagine synthase (glutamine-hydrolyzing) n=1 Tax=Lacibacter luteus TaxID=2508719 RepID=A0A4Q1CJY6_9BACT|nr:asparagine synthase (glutamine-hydrolyzing) [Lacibacter luteus]RXK60940.1 asparagine synthase (glutamine-hydrolyzing) [Lacibacter luteus]
MCGIAGIISRNPNQISTQRLQQMTDALAHRGPDGEGFWINASNNVGFGHRRLAIIDLSDAGKQPMHYLNRYSITYNGELYNYIELRETLQQKGYSFRTQTDTEVLLAAYDCWKEQCLQQFDGMFAFAIWDEQEQNLFAARDRFGEKPFYYSFDGEQFVFASEMKALWAAGITRSVDHSMLLNYIALGWVKNPADLSQTFYQNISNLPQAHYLQLSLQNGTNEIVQYFDLDKETTLSISEADAAEQLLHLLNTSVKRRLRSDVEVGTSLSGGLDSSSIVAMINQLQTRNHKLQTFTASFPGFEKDETAYAKQVADKFQLQQHFVTPTADTLSNDIENLIFQQEEPFQSSSIYAQYKVYELAKQNNIKVILDGQGADETLAGYHKYIHWFLQEKSRESSVVNRELKAFTDHHISVDWSWKNKLAARFPEFTAVQLENKANKAVLNHKFISNHYRKEHFNKKSIYKPAVSKLNDLLYYNTMLVGLEELLRYADRNSMAHGVEVRLPFLSHELVQFIFSLPSHYKINNGFTKNILRQCIKEHLPAAIVYRTDKVGYEPPQQQWMQSPAFAELLNQSRQKLVKENILRKSILQQPVNAQPAHAVNNDDWRYFCAAHLL